MIHATSPHARPPRPAAFEPSEEEVQRCAYFLWKEEGSPAGRDLELWLKAKELLRHRAARPAPRPGPPRRAPRR